MCIVGGEIDLTRLCSFELEEILKGSENRSGERKGKCSLISDMIKLRCDTELGW